MVIRGPLQLHLWWLFAGTTVAAIYLAIYTQVGHFRFWEGLGAAAAIIGIFDPVMPFFMELGRAIIRDWDGSSSQHRDDNRDPFQGL